MHLEHAEHTLETIRTLMERSQRYEHVSGASGLVAGAAVLAGSGVLGLKLLPFAPGVNFAVAWSIVFAVSLAAHCVFTWGRVRQAREKLWSRQARTIILALLPALAAGGAVTVLMARLGRVNLLPALWLLLYGCGVLATSFFAPRSILRLGLCCLAAGAISAVLLPGWPALTMAVGFGLTHLGFGVCVTVSEWRERREQMEWLSWQQTPAN